MNINELKEMISQIPLNTGVYPDELRYILTDGWRVAECIDKDHAQFLTHVCNNFISLLDALDELYWAINEKDRKGYLKEYCDSVQKVIKNAQEVK